MNTSTYPERLRIGTPVILLGLAFLLGSLPLGAQANPTTAPKPASRQITDMAGRTVTIPAVVGKAYSLNPIGTVAMYTLNPERIAALNNPPGAGEKKFLSPVYLSLPVWGQATGGHGNVNLEALIAGHPDVIFSGPLDPSQINAAQQIQDKTGIPVIMLDQSLENFEAFYLLVGSVLGENDRAKELAAYARKVINRAKALAATIPPAQRPRVYYAEGADGLQTDPAGSFHTQVLDILGGVNVAQVPKLSQAGGMVGMSQVSFEQLAAWNPDLVIASSNALAGANGGTRGVILGDERWKSLNAGKAGRIYAIPSVPFDWFDRPPSTNRLIGLSWLACVLYPDKANLDLKKEVRDYYQLFYHINLSDADLAELLKGALP